MWFASRLLIVLAVGIGEQGATVPTVPAGIAPASVGTLQQVLWTNLDTTDSPAALRPCVVEARSVWRCPAIAPGQRGAALLIGTAGATVTSSGTAVALPPAGEWGRLLRIVPGGAPVEAVHDAQISAWMPERSEVRRDSRRFAPVEAPGVSVVFLSPAVAWISGGAVDPDAYLSVDAPEFASVRLPLADIASGAPDAEVFVPADLPNELAGRVETKAGTPIDDASVEIYESTVTAVDSAAPLAERPLVRRASTTTAADGTFAFRRLDAGRYYLTVFDATNGKAAQEVRSLGPPVVIRLRAPQHLRGRVLRRNVPVAGARVRFIPDEAAFRASADPMAYVGQETQSGTDGRFTLALPENTNGSVQILLADRSVALRRPIPNISRDDIELGDVVLPDPRAVTLRLLNGEDECAIIAVGPLSGAGLSEVRQTGIAALYWFEFPEAGEWALSAACGEDNYSVKPPVITVPASGPTPTVEVVLDKPGGVEQSEHLRLAPGLQGVHEGPVGFPARLQLRFEALGTEIEAKIRVKAPGGDARALGGGAGLDEVLSAIG
jgi:hypothetical protein